MRTRSKTVRVLKWVGVIACALIFVLFLVSLRWTVGLPALRVFVIRGAFEVELYEVWWTRSAFYVNESPHHRWRDYMLWPRWDSGDSVRIPLWIFLCVAMVPTGMLIRTRNLPHGHCTNCGYDLTGNVSGVCSECGTPVGKKE